MKLQTYLDILKILKEHYPTWNAPVVTLIAQQHGDPYRVLVSTMLSLRTTDQVTSRASDKLFAQAPDIYALNRLTIDTIKQEIYPVGFYKNKAKHLKKLAQTLIENNDGKVPSTLQELMALDGVGLKTANLTLALGFNIPAICVDIHVHRISNRFGFVRTKTPDETEQRLSKKVPKDRWNEINDLLVAFGQTICRPLSPHCTICPAQNECEQIAVTRFR